ncbi:MAG TPA: type II secretion system protein [Patescibacteria group bacterium]|jgi:prepilin-type N-terminal cleavage/methylation domain-containing protein|nr:type II secretion system protein [Patescibacteria group bacterium]
MTRHKGFTVIEVLVVLAFLLGGAVLFVTQKAAIDAAGRDNDRKVAINAMYYSLEEVYYRQNQSYPESISSKVLRSVDPALFTDPDGFTMGDPGSSYHYEASGCDLKGHCKSYRLYADMQKEASYVKTSRH